MATTRMIAALALTTALLPLAAAAQEPPEARFGEELVVTEVLLDVLVTDARGNVIIGLDEGDFIVEEDGEPVELTSATFYSNLLVQEPALAAGAETETRPADRYFVLFFHDQRQDLSALTAQQLDAARWLKRWARRELLPNDFVAVVSYDVKLKVHQDFTNDRQAILKAIDDGIISRDTGGNWPSRHPDSGLSLARSLPTGPELRRQTKQFYDGVELVAEALDDLRGRKNLLLFSIGFGEVDEFGGWSPDPRYYPDMVEALNDSNVAVYAVDWIPSTAGGTAFARGLNDSLSLLAEDTGGQYFLHFASFGAPLSEISRENNGYYLLSYRSGHQRGESGFQEVKVRTTSPEFTVRARKGYRYGTP